MVCGSGGRDAPTDLQHLKPIRRTTSALLSWSTARPERTASCKPNWKRLAFRTRRGCTCHGLDLSQRPHDGVLAEQGQPVARTVQIAPGGTWSAEELIDELGLPCFVKPNETGSSIGISKVSEAPSSRPPSMPPWPLAAAAWSWSPCCRARIHVRSHSGCLGPSGGLARDRNPDAPGIF